jgi:hypothetical protein
MTKKKEVPPVKPVVKTKKEEVVKKTPDIKEEIAIIAKDLPVVMKIVIKNDEEFAITRERYKEVQAMGKNLADKKKAILTPINEAIQQVKALFKEPEARFLEVSEAFQLGLSKYANDAEIARLRALESITKDKRLKNIDTIQTKIEEAGDRLSGTMKLKRLIINNPDLIPREYMMPDEAKIKAALIAGSKIKGVELKEELVVTTR